MAIHSQSLTVPQCPRGWKDMWIGYSFAMVGPRQFSRCQVLSKWTSICTKLTQLTGKDNFHSSFENPILDTS